MQKMRFREEQIIGILQEMQAGATIREVCSLKRIPFSRRWTPKGSSSVATPTTRWTTTSRSTRLLSTSTPRSEASASSGWID